jgi:hypothetical protein
VILMLLTKMNFNFSVFSALFIMPTHISNISTRANFSWHSQMSSNAVILVGTYQYYCGATAWSQCTQPLGLRAPCSVPRMYWFVYYTPSLGLRAGRSVLRAYCSPRNLWSALFVHRCVIRLLYPSSVSALHAACCVRFVCRCVIHFVAGPPYCVLCAPCCTVPQARTYLLSAYNTELRVCNSNFLAIQAFPKHFKLIMRYYQHFESILCAKVNVRASAGNPQSHCRIRHAIPDKKRRQFDVVSSQHHPISLYKVRSVRTSNMFVEGSDVRAKEHFRACVFRVEGKRNNCDHDVSLLGSATLYSRKAYLLTSSHCVYEDYGSRMLKQDLCIVADGLRYPFEVVYATPPNVWPGLAVIRVNGGQVHGNKFMRAQPPYAVVLLLDR